MKISLHSRREGIALVIVMMVILVLAVMAGGFAYSMKVETKLARNTSFEADMDLLGRSGVELARYVLAQQLRIPGENTYAGLNQKWAGGPGGTNELLADIHLEDNELGPGKFSIKIVDMERKYNLAMLRDNNTHILEQGLKLVGVDSADVSTIVDSYLDWIDPDEATHLHGAESADYLKLDPNNPHFAKNGIMDDLSELLLLKGMTPDIYWGSGRTGRPVSVAGGRPVRRPRSAFLDTALSGEGATGVGLVDLFTTISGAGIQINVNTASADVLQLIPGVDASMAQAIVSTRAGSDGQDSTEDDTPFFNQGELINVPGMDPQILQVVRGTLGVQSAIFEVTVDAQIGSYHRRHVAVVHRRNIQDVQVLYSHWK